MLLEDHEAPLVSGTALVRTGAIYEPADRAGLAGLTGALIRGGGSKLRTAEQLDAELEVLGAAIDSSIGESIGTVGFTTAKATLAQTLAVYRDVLTAPAFRPDRIDQAKSFGFAAIARRNDDPRQVLRREFTASLMGKETAESRRSEYSTIAPINRGNIEAFYRRYFFPANTTLVVAGDFDTAAMKGSIETLFGSWTSEQPPVADFPKTNIADAGGSFLVSRPEYHQGFLALGRAGATYRDNDAAALAVTAALLGNGPHSRLWRLREETSSGVSEMTFEAQPGLLTPGIFAMMATVMPSAASDAAKAAIDEIKKLRTAEPTEEEVRTARERVWSRACEGLDNRWRAAVLQATAEYYGYPADFLQQFLNRVAAVTKADVLRVAKERLDPARLTLTIASNLRVFSDPREIPTIPVDLTIPARKEAPATALQSDETGKKLLARAQQAVGGADKLAAVKDVTLKTSFALTVGGTDDEFDEWIAPSILRQDGKSTRFGRLIRFTDGATGWVSNGYNSGPLTAAAIKQSRGDLMRLLIPLLLSDRVAGRIVTALDEETIEIVQGDLAAQLVLEKQTGLPSQLHYELVSDRGQPVLMEENYSDFRDVNGIKLPFAVTIYQNGQKYAQGVVSELKLNQGLKAEVLQRRP
jgi:zinc protease